MDGSHGSDSSIHDRAGHRISSTIHAPGQRIRRHDHRSTCVHLVLGGLYIELLDGIVRVALPGDAIFKAAGAPHANLFGRDGAWTYRVALVEAPASVLSALDRHGFHLASNAAAGIVSQLRGAQLRSAARTSRQRLDRVLRMASPHEGSSHHGHVSATSPEIDAARRLRDDPAQSIATLASSLGLERTSLAHRFRRRFHCSMREYSLHARVAEVATRMSREEGSLSQLFATAGFCDQSHGTRAFSRVLGLPPRAWERAVASLA